MAAAADLVALIEQSLRCVWFYGAITEVGAHTTGWQNSPAAGVVQIHGLRTRIERRGSPPCAAEDGAAILIQAHEVHRLTSTCTGTTPGRCRYASIAFFILGGIDVLSLFTLPAVVTGPRAQRIGDACAGRAALQAEPAASAVTQAALRLQHGLAILGALLEGAAANARGTGLVRHAARIEPVLTWMEQHPARPAGLDALARMAGLSPSRFHALFREVMQCAPMAYRLRRRIHRAQELLLTTAQPVQAIAQAVGFANAFHFSRVFHRTAGVSPSAYRRHVGPWPARETPSAPPAAPRR